MESLKIVLVILRSSGLIIPVNNQLSNHFFSSPGFSANMAFAFCA
jgi:hypothetical protein